MSFPRTLDLGEKRIYSVAVADFNNDGYEDVAAGVFSGYSVVFFNNKDDTFSEKMVI